MPRRPTHKVNHFELQAVARSKGNHLSQQGWPSEAACQEAIDGVSFLYEGELRTHDLFPVSDIPEEGVTRWLPGERHKATWFIYYKKVEPNEQS